ncbi:MAG: diaminopimelate epimerase [Verrucomicrobiota bacterium]|jgi:diaminopimelate epimerase|nr:diaminopimelate epimerase [Verrucomicrobiota bacterium]
MMRLCFWKMHGAGNDFILVDDRCLTFPATDAAYIAQLCHRRLGIGSDGLLLLQSVEQADFRMRFFNPDGRAAALCGNAARCAARLAYDLGMAPAAMRMATDAGVVSAVLLEDMQIRLHMPPPREWRMDQTVEWQGTLHTVHFVISGVPHAVVVLPDLANVDVAAFGSFLRHHRLFAPDGTNADFIHVLDEHTLGIRTFERGVEGETPACGTGITAAALIAEKRGLVASPVRLKTAGGDVLEVTTSPLTLTGPAEYVFCGSVDYRA